MKSKPKCGRRKVWSNFPPASASFEKRGHNDIYMFAFLRSRTEREVGEAPGHDPHTLLLRGAVPLLLFFIGSPGVRASQCVLFV